MKLTVRSSAFAAAIVGFAVSLTIYSSVVILTTPNLAPLTSLLTSLRMSPHFMLGIPLGVATQAYFSFNVKQTCPVQGRAVAFGGTATGSALSAGLSFFGLTQVGCCTLWLFYLSLLSSVIGGGVAGFLIRYSVLLSNISLIFVWIPVLWLSVRIRRAKAAQNQGAVSSSASRRVSVHG